MTIESQLVCEHGIPARTLSAWRDGDLRYAHRHPRGWMRGEPGASGRL